MIANPIQAIAARSISTGLSSLRGLRWLVSLICWADRLADCWVGQFAWSVCFSFLLGVVQDVWLVWKVDCAVFESMCQGSSIFHLSPLLLKRLSLAHVVIMHALYPPLIALDCLALSVPLGPPGPRGFNPAVISHRRAHRVSRPHRQGEGGAAQERYLTSQLASRASQPSPARPNPPCSLSPSTISRLSPPYLALRSSNTAPKPALTCPNPP